MQVYFLPNVKTEPGRHDRSVRQAMVYDELATSGLGLAISIWDWIQFESVEHARFLIFI